MESSKSNGIIYDLRSMLNNNFTGERYSFKAQLMNNSFTYMSYRLRYYKSLIKK